MYNRCTEGSDEEPGIRSQKSFGLSLTRLEEKKVIIASWGTVRSISAAVCNSTMPSNP